MRRRSWKAFVFFAVVVGLLFVALGVMLGKEGIQNGEMGGALVFAFVMVLLGIGLLVGAVAAFRTFANLNMGKKDASVEIRYTMEMDGQVQTLLEGKVLRDALLELTGGKEIIVTLAPEFFGLTTWRFIRIKGQYISFVEIHKKEKKLEYFIMPTADIDKALEAFWEVFDEHKAVDTTKLIDMKRYKAVMEYYKLG